jgi:hypothetical protein
MTALFDIFNRALSACGVESGISDPDENSREAAVCRLWYPVVRDNVLAAAPWPSVRKFTRLALSVERDINSPWQAGNPNPRYRFAYASPSDLLQPYHLQSYLPFSFDIVGTSRAFSCNEENPIMHYNARVVDPSLWEPNLALAVVHTLATYISIPITGRDQRLMQNAELAFRMVEQAQTAAANSSDEKEENLPEWFQVRGYGDLPVSRFYYPMQSLSVGFTV